MRWQPAPMKQLADLHPALVVRMDRQGGVFTAAQARAVGHTDSQLQVLRRRKILVSVRRGVYAWSAVYVTADPQTSRSGSGVARTRVSAGEHAAAAHRLGGYVP